MLLLSNFLKTAGIFDEMDVLARAQFLEGFLGAAPFTRIRGLTGKTQLLGKIGDMAKEIGGVSPEWLSKGDTGLYRKAFMNVNKIIRSQNVERTTEAADLMQSLMGLQGWGTDEEGNNLAMGGKSLFWAAGRYSAQKNSKVMAEGYTPDEASRQAITFVFRRALDVIKSEKTRARYNETWTNEEEMVTKPDSDEPDSWSAVIDALFTHPDHPLAKQFFDWLYEKLPKIMIRAKRGERIKQYLDLLRSGQRGLSDSESAAAIGATLSQFSGAKIEFMNVLEQYISSHPDEQAKILNLFQKNPTQVQSLLSGRMANLRNRVAGRYLARLREAKAREARIDLAEQVASIYMSRLAGKAPVQIVDPESGLGYEELKAQFDQTLDEMYKSNKKTDVIKQYRKDMGGRVERLRQRIQKAERGLRLSTSPKDLAGMPKTIDLFQSADSKISAIVSSEGVVGWVRQLNKQIPLMVPNKNYSYGHTNVKRFTVCGPDGKKLPGSHEVGSANDALDVFAEWMKKQLPAV